MATKTATPPASTPIKQHLRVHVSRVFSVDNVRERITDESVEDLMGSILTFGQMQEATVFEMGVDESTNSSTAGQMCYQIHVGHRRHWAITRLAAAGKHDGMIDVAVAERLDEGSRIVEQLIENLHREDLNPVEEAHAFSRIVVDYKYKQKQLAELLGRSATYVSDRIALLKLPDVVLAAVGRGIISVEVGRALAAVGDDAVVLKLTENGKLQPSSYQIVDAKAKGELKRMKDEITKAAIAHGIVKLSNTYVPHGMKVVHKFESVAEFDELKKPIVMKEGMVAYIDASTYPKAHATITVCRPTTEKEKAAEQAKAQAQRQKQNEEWQAERAEKIEAERAAWTPEFREWKDACAAIRATHEAAVAEYEAQIEKAEANWYRTVKATDVARFAMRLICTRAGNYGNSIGAYPHQVVNLLELRTEDNQHVEDSDLVRAFTTESAANLVAVTAVHCVVCDAAGEARQCRDAAVAKLGIVAPANPVYPPQPQTDSPEADAAVDEEMADREDHVNEHAVSSYDPDAGDEGEYDEGGEE